MKRGEVAGFSRFVSIRDFRLNGDQCFDRIFESPDSIDTTGQVLQIIRLNIFFLCIFRNYISQTNVFVDV